MILIGPTFFFSQPNKEFECRFNYVHKNYRYNTQSDLDGLAKFLRLATDIDIPKTIVYVQSKDVAWKVHHLLQQAALKRCYVGMYRADLTSHTKSVVHQHFRGSSSTLRCLVATVAFGMVGIHR